MNGVEESVRKILEACRTESTEFYTHVSLINPKGKFNIDRSYTELFWKNYCKLLKKVDNPIIGIAEKPQIFLPILVDIDIKIKEDELDEEYDISETLYTHDQILTLIKVYQQVIRETIQDVKDEHQICFVLEKPGYIKEQNGIRYVKNGFHLHFPYVFLKQDEHKNVIIPRAKKLVKDTKVFAPLGFENSEDLIDEAVCRNAWLLYGSIKSEENPQAYYVTHIYDKNCEELSYEDALANYKIYDSEEKEIDIHEKEEYYLPRILSIHPFGRETCLLKQVARPPEKKKVAINIKKMSDFTVSENIKLARELLPLLDKKRAEKYEEWIQMKFIFYNISKGCQEGLDLFLEFSSWCGDKFREDVCVNEWAKTTCKEEGGRGMGSLRHYARVDSPDKYKKVFETKAEKYIMASINNGGNHNDIAKAMREKYGDRFVCADSSMNEWYEYNYEEHRYKRSDEGIALRMKLSDEVVDLYSDVYKKMVDQIKDIDGDDAKKLYQAKLNQVQKIMFNLKTAPFKNNVMKEAKEVFYNPQFKKLLDRNKYLLGFPNGVYDLHANIFREGSPDDYISISMGTPYIEYKETDKEVEEIYDFFEKIFPDKEVRQYFMNISSDVFVGGNFNKKVYFWSGVGNNGKTITQNMMEKMLGDYAKKLPVSLLTGKRGPSSGASPELARINGTRWAVLQEPGKTETINIGILKELSGNDTFYCRGLYNAGGEIEPQFKLVVICNDPPLIPQSDTATWNRIRVIPFESEFVDNPPATYEEQLLQKKFAKDIHFETEKLPHMISPLAWVLLEHRKRASSKIEPEKVISRTKEYQTKNDSFRQFVDDMIVVDKKGSITLSELYRLYKEWFKESMPNSNVPSKSEVKEYFTKLWKEAHNGKWKGYRERVDADNEASDSESDDE
jgi:P4 family phage/plasmid primase-like protien